MTLSEVYRCPTGNTVLYLQNLNDEYHLVRHLEPFLAAQHPDNRIHVHQDRWREGHTPPPKELLRATLERLVSDEPWDEVARSLATG